MEVDLAVVKLLSSSVGIRYLESVWLSQGGPGDLEAFDALCSSISRGKYISSPKKSIRDRGAKAFFLELSKQEIKPKTDMDALLPNPMNILAFCRALAKQSRRWSSYEPDELITLALLLDTENDGYVSFQNFLDFVYKLQGLLSSKDGVNRPTVAMHNLYKSYVLDKRKAARDDFLAEINSINKDGNKVSEETLDRLFTDLLKIAIDARHRHMMPSMTLQQLKYSEIVLEWDKEMDDVDDTSDNILHGHNSYHTPVAATSTKRRSTTKRRMSRKGKSHKGAFPLSVLISLLVEFNVSVIDEEARRRHLTIEENERHAREESVRQNTQESTSSVMSLFGTVSSPRNDSFDDVNVNDELPNSESLRRSIYSPSSPHNRSLSLSAKRSSIKGNTSPRSTTSSPRNTPTSTPNTTESAFVDPRNINGIENSNIMNLPLEDIRMNQDTTKSLQEILDQMKTNTQYINLALENQSEALATIYEQVLNHPDHRISTWMVDNLDVDRLVGSSEKDGLRAHKEMHVDATTSEVEEKTSPDNGTKERLHLRDSPSINVIASLHSRSNVKRKAKKSDGKSSNSPGGEDEDSVVDSMDPSAVAASHPPDEIYHIDYKSSPKSLNLSIFRSPRRSSTSPFIEGARGFSETAGIEPEVIKARQELAEEQRNSAKRTKSIVRRQSFRFSS